MKTKDYNIALIMFCLAGGLMVSCSRQDQPSPVSPAGSGDEIRFDVSVYGEAQIKDVPSSKAAGDDHFNTYEKLQKRCTPAADGGEGRNIGLYSSYKVYDADGNVTEENKNFMDGVFLRYQAGNHAQQPDEDPDRRGWNTFEGASGSTALIPTWKRGAEYKFRAYFPANGVISIDETQSNSDVFVANYTAETAQEDLLMAYSYVNTNDASQTGKHVQLAFRHILSAVRFKFYFQDGYFYDEFLSEMWLENRTAEYTRSLQMTSQFTYASDHLDPKKDKLTWEISATPAPGAKMYHWKAADPASSALKLSEKSDDKPVIPYKNASSVPEGRTELYTQMDGYFILIPHSADVDTDLCFCLKTRPGVVFRVALPKTIKMEGEGGAAYTSDAYEPGNRYTFNVIISDTNLDVARISIEAWREYEMSHTIIF